MPEKSTLESEESELDDADWKLTDEERVALRLLIQERMQGKFFDMDQSRRQIEAMIAAKRKAYGL